MKVAASLPDAQKTVTTHVFLPRAGSLIYIRYEGTNIEYLIVLSCKHSVKLQEESLAPYVIFASLTNSTIHRSRNLLEPVLCLAISTVP